jgi:outer membrane protein TolC
MEDHHVIDNWARRDAGLVAALLLVGVIGGAPRLAAQQDTTGQAHTVTLDQAINLALQTQPAIIQAEGNLDVAHANQRQALGSFLPSITASGNMSQSSNTRINATTGIPQTFPGGVSYSTGLNASLVLFNGFARFAQTRSANATAASADAALTNQKFQVILQTKQAFFNALAAVDLVSAAQTSSRPAAASARTR